MNARYPFVEGAFYEDVDFLCRHLLDAERMMYCNACGYRFYSNPASITHTFSYKHLCGYALLGTRMLSLYEKLEDRSSSFALSLLEGGRFNIQQAFRKLIRLESVIDVCAFYNILDSRINRKSLLKYRTPAQYWTLWTLFCLKHRQVATWLVGCFITLGGKNLIKKGNKS